MMPLSSVPQHQRRLRVLVFIGPDKQIKRPVGIFTRLGLPNIMQ
jgi:hypothetical protein